MRARTLCLLILFISSASLSSEQLLPSRPDYDVSAGPITLVKLLGADGTIEKLRARGFHVERP